MSLTVDAPAPGFLVLADAAKAAAALKANSEGLAAALARLKAAGIAERDAHHFQRQRQEGLVSEGDEHDEEHRQQQKGDDEPARRQQ